MRAKLRFTIAPSRISNHTKPNRRWSPWSSGWPQRFSWATATIQIKRSVNRRNRASMLLWQTCKYFSSYTCSINMSCCSTHRRIPQKIKAPFFCFSLSRGPALGWWENDKHTEHERVYFFGSTAHARMFLHARTTNCMLQKVVDKGYGGRKRHGIMHCGL